MIDDARRSLCLVLLISHLVSATSSTTRNVSSKKVSSSWNINEAADSSDVGYRFYPYSFRSPTGYNLYQCALYCEQDRRCKSFNYLSKENICELNDEERESVDVPAYVQVGKNLLESVNRLVPYEGSQYFSREAFTLKSKNSLSECSADPPPCPADHACSSGDSGSYQCQKLVFTNEDFYKNWNEWGNWSDCTVSCGTGVQERTRECETSEFWLCKGRSSERRLCSETLCPIWSAWGPWSDCDSPNGCGFGNRNRTRECLYGSIDLCAGNDTDERMCRKPSCDAPAMLSSGKHGDVFMYDDSRLYEPEWRRVCEPETEKTALTVKLAICNALGLDLADDDVTPGTRPNDDDLVFQPKVCPLDARRLMSCIHNGWIKASECGKLLAVKCTESDLDAPANGEATRCSNDPAVTIACPGEKEIRVDGGFYGREKGTTTCSASAVNSECFATDALKIFEETCSHHTSCSLPASSNSFGGNPCPASTTSYSKLKFSCIRFLIPFYAGMKSGDIADSKITASSFRSPNNAAHHGRLDRSSYCWMPLSSAVSISAAAAATAEWIMVNFDSPVYILGAITQSKSFTDHGDHWVTSYYVACGNATNTLVRIRDDEGNPKVFPGNTGFHTYNINYFAKPVFARFARLIVKEWADEIAIRMEWLIAD